MADSNSEAELKLGAFRFTDRDASKARHEVEEKESSGGNPKIDHNPAIHPFGRSTASERMKSDKPGEELAEGAAIWDLYLEEANRHDQEMIKARNSSLDMLLLFAALFSAIVTAFLIESKALLQQDPADTSIVLLTLIAQSQRRMELGLPPLFDSSSPIAAPDLSPSSSARWVNAIWFTSLGLSLAAALIAMLGKEWLAAYLDSRPRPAHNHTIIRQSRLEGLEDWWALHIIAFLPSVLHAALLLFSIGLVLYLWTIDTAIAAVVAGLTGFTVLFYITTAILGAIYEFCPFATQISGYLQGIYCKIMKQQKSTHSRMSSIHRDLRALLWLANHASDPAITDSAYQALAGIQSRSNTVQVYNAEFEGQGSESLITKMPIRLDKNTSLWSLLSDLLARFDCVMNDRGLITENCGTNAARYAVAVRNLLSILRHSSRPNERMMNVQNDLSVDPGDERFTGLEILSLRPLALIGNLWHDTPALNASAYAGFLAAELELLSMAASDVAMKMTDQQEKGSLLNLRDGIPKLFAQSEPYRIDILPAHLSVGLDHQISLLRARYSCALVRATQLLRFHLFSEVSLESNSVVALANSMCTGGRCDVLNPIDSISTHHPTQETQHKRYRFVMPIYRSDKIIIRSDDLRIGPLGTLVLILRTRPMASDDSLLELRMAALDALSALAPVLLQQILGLDRNELVEAYNFRDWPYKPKANLLGAGYLVVRQMLLTLRYLGTCFDRSTEHMMFCNDMAQLIFEYMEESKGAAYSQGPGLAIVHNSEDLVPILEYIGSSESNLGNLPTSLVDKLMGFLTFRLGTEQDALFDIWFTPKCYFALIKIMKHVEVSPRLARNIFDAMVRRLRRHNDGDDGQTLERSETPPIDYLRQFTHTSQGFKALVTLANKEHLKPPVVDFIAQLYHMASGRDRVSGFESIQISSVAVPGLSNAVSVCIQHMLSEGDREEDLLAFLEDAFVLVMVASELEESKEYLIQHSIYQELYNSCWSFNNSRGGSLRQSIYIQGVQLGIGLEEWHSTDED